MLLGIDKCKGEDIALGAALRKNHNRTSFEQRGAQWMPFFHCVSKQTSIKVAGTFNFSL